jgi:tripartite-type tricarboxylate transporter receptor subunit TctC
MRTRSFFGLISLCAAMVLAGNALAQAYPSKTVHLIDGFSPGGSTDIVGRLIAQKLSESFGQPVLVENRPGATGTVAAEMVAKSAPDGHVMLIVPLTFTVSPSLYKLPYDPVKDLAPVTLVASAPLMLAVHPSVPVKSVAELIAYAKANPGKLHFGSGGVGSTPHLAGEMLKGMAGIDATHVPYKGGGPALADLASGQIQFMVENIPSTAPYVTSGRLRALAVTDLKRSPVLPDVPTLDESGVKGYQIIGWNGLFLPAGTPPAIVDKLHAEVAKALAQADVKERLAKMGFEGVGDTPQHFAAFVQGEIAKWAKVVKDANIKIE